ncbi:MAG: mechanosensitive ion channel family protein [Acidimicrobiales bacterium]
MSEVLDLVVAAQSGLTAAEVDTCGQDAGAACLFVLRTTDNAVLARAADLLVAKPLKVALIVVLALVVNRLVQRAIGRFLRGLESAVPRGLRAADRHAAALLMTGPAQLRSRQRTETIGAVLRSLTKMVIAVIAGLMVLSEFGVDLGPLIAGAGIVGVALGFGSQSLVKDFLSGAFILVEDQFGVGDIIDVGEASGVVEGVSMRVTRLRDVQGVMWHVPNGEIRRVGNHSQEWSRALIDVEVAYGTDLSHAQSVIKAVADEVWRDQAWAPSILDEPDVWGVETLGPSGVLIRLVVKTKPSDQWKVMRVLRHRIKDAFDDEGIEIPFPQQSVWVRGPAGGADRGGAPHLTGTRAESGDDSGRGDSGPGGGGGGAP